MEGTHLGSASASVMLGGSSHFLWISTLKLVNVVNVIKKTQNNTKNTYFSQRRTNNWIIFPMTEISPVAPFEFLQGDDRERSAGKTWRGGSIQAASEQEISVDLILDILSRKLTVDMENRTPIDDSQICIDYFHDFPIYIIFPYMSY